MPAVQYKCLFTAVKRKPVHECTLCGLVSISKSALDWHMRVHRSELFCCDSKIDTLLHKAVY